MNYIELINYFWIENLEHSFTGNETKLYYYLLHTSNSLGWKNPFRQSDRQIQLGTGISLNSIKSGRNRLAQSGLITFKAGKQGNKFNYNNKTEYSLIKRTRPVSVSKIDPDTHPDTHPDTNPDTHPDKGGHTDGINKQNKTKLNETSDHNSTVPSTVPDESKDSSKSAKVVINYKKLIEQFKIYCPLLPEPVKLTESRRASIRSRVKEHGKRSVLVVFEKTGNSDFLSGRKSDFKASFDWIFKPQNYVKILEGNYDNDLDIKTKMEVTF
jgi:hypothetical protein